MIIFGNSFNSTVESKCLMEDYIQVLAPYSWCAFFNGYDDPFIYLEDLHALDKSCYNETVAMENQ